MWRGLRADLIAAAFAAIHSFPQGDLLRPDANKEALKLRRKIRMVTQPLHEFRHFNFRVPWPVKLPRRMRAKARDLAPFAFRHQRVRHDGKAAGDDGRAEQVMPGHRRFADHKAGIVATIERLAKVRLNLDAANRLMVGL